MVLVALWWWHFALNANQYPYMYVAPHLTVYLLPSSSTFFHIIIIYYQLLLYSLHYLHFFLFSNYRRNILCSEGRKLRRRRRAPNLGRRAKIDVEVHHASQASYSHLQRGGV